MTPTSGMNIAQRILHVGGRNNAAGYVEFGSIQAVEALVRQVLRDLPPADVPLLRDDEIYEMYSEPRSDAEMLEFGREVEAAVRKLFIAALQAQPRKAVKLTPTELRELHYKHELGWLCAFEDLVKLVPVVEAAVWEKLGYRNDP